MKRTLLMLATLVATTAAAQDDIRPAALAAHMRFLASDLLEGRGAGTRGYDLAAAYVAAMLESYGLAPAGEGGTYLQGVKLRQVVRDPERSVVELTHDGKPFPFVNNQDYLINPAFFAEQTSVTAPLVFVGYGISAPGHGHDDYANIDVKGKIVVMMGDAPPSLPSAVRAHYTGLHKVMTASARGAVALLSAAGEADNKLFPWERVLAYSAFPRMRAARPDGTLIDVFPQLQALGGISFEGMKRLMSAAGRDLATVEAELKKGATQSFDLPFAATIRGAGRHTDLHSANVVAMLRGSDPKLRDEYVVFTAHLDHMGTGAAVDGDSIYNGAYDNAAGSAALLEIARAFSEMRPRPKRSILFLFVTAEERGMLGSNYFAQNPTVPIDRIVANVNIDGLTMLYNPSDVIVLGGEHSSIGPVAARAAAQLGMTVSPDPMPEQVFFVRSDQYSFVRQGVPAIAAFAGTKADTGGTFWKWMQTVYHTPKDDLTQPFDFDAGAKMTRFYFLTGAFIANETAPPAWNEGDFFGRTYGRR